MWLTSFALKEVAAALKEKEENQRPREEGGALEPRDRYVEVSFYVVAVGVEHERGMGEPRRTRDETPGAPLSMPPLSTRAACDSARRSTVSRARECDVRAGRDAVSIWLGFLTVCRASRRRPAFQEDVCIAFELAPLPALRIRSSASAASYMRLLVARSADPDAHVIDDLTHASCFARPSSGPPRESYVICGSEHVAGERLESHVCTE